MTIHCIGPTKLKLLCFESRRAGPPDSIMTIWQQVKTSVYIHRSPYLYIYIHTQILTYIYTYIYMYTHRYLIYRYRYHIERYRHRIERYRSFVGGSGDSDLVQA